MNFQTRLVLAVLGLIRLDGYLKLTTPLSFFESKCLQPHPASQKFAPIFLIDQPLDPEQQFLQILHHQTSLQAV